MCGQDQLQQQELIEEATAAFKHTAARAFWPVVLHTWEIVGKGTPAEARGLTVSTKSRAPILAAV